MQHDTVKVSLPYGKGRLEMELDSARCRFIGAYGVAAPEEGLADTGAAVAEALASPIGSPRLREIARGCTDLVIISDDATRLTPVSLILPGVLEELRAAGVDEDAVTVVMANGTHRPMTQEEIEAKLGTDLARRLRG